jgi:hypothetical protein
MLNYQRVARLLSWSVGEVARFFLVNKSVVGCVFRHKEIGAPFCDFCNTLVSIFQYQKSTESSSSHFGMWTTKNPMNWVSLKVIWH